MIEPPPSSQRVFIHLPETREISFYDLFTLSNDSSSSPSKSSVSSKAERIINLIARVETFGRGERHHTIQDDDVEDLSFISASQNSDYDNEKLTQSINLGFSSIPPSHFNTLKRSREAEFPSELDHLIKSLQSLISSSKKKYIGVEAAKHLKKINQYLNTNPDINRDKVFEKIEIITKKKPEQILKIIEIDELKAKKKEIFHQFCYKKEKFMQKNRSKYFEESDRNSEFNELKTILSSYLDLHNKISLLQSKKKNLLTLQELERKHLMTYDRDLKRKSIGCPYEAKTDDSEKPPSHCHSEINFLEISSPE